MDQSATRPVGLYVVGIGAMLFGLLGMCTQGITLASTVQQGGAMQPGSFPQDDTFRELAELQSSMYVPTMVSAGVGVMVALVLLVFGALTIARLSLALLTPAVLLGAAIIELLQLAVSVYYQMKTAELMGGLTGGLDAAVGGGTGIESMASMAMGIGLCVLGGWGVLKCAFFGAGAVYLRKPELRRLFEAPPTLGPRGD